MSINTTLAGIDTSMFNTGSGFLASTTPVGVQTSSGNGLSNVLNIAGSLLGGGTDIGSLASTGLSFATLGISDMVSGLLGIDIGSNINNVLSYGLSSWGAATNPDKQTLLAQQDITPLAEMLKTLNETNIVDMINYVEYKTAFIYQFYINMAGFRSWAGSTKAGFKKRSELIGEFRTNVLKKLIDKLPSHGIDVTSTIINSSFVTEQSKNSINEPDKRFREVQNYKPFTYRLFSFSLNKKILATKTDANGDLLISSKNNTNTYLIVGGIALVLFWKKIKKTLKL